MAAPLPTEAKIYAKVKELTAKEINLNQWSDKLNALIAKYKHKDMGEVIKP